VLFVRLIASAHLPLRLVESIEFRDFLFYLNKDVETWLPSSYATIQGWIRRQYTEQKERIKQRLYSAISLIYIALNPGTLPNGKPLIIIYAHYITEDSQLEKSTLAIKEVLGGHNSLTYATYVIDLINEFRIASKLGYFQIDNTPNNNTLLHAVVAGTSPFYLTRAC
jgi:hypothetical protein